MGLETETGTRCERHTLDDSSEGVYPSGSRRSWEESPPLPTVHTGSKVKRQDEFTFPEKSQTWRPQGGAFAGALGRSRRAAPRTQHCRAVPGRLRVTSTVCERARCRAGSAVPGVSEAGGCWGPADKEEL